jgi:hypothetical protein
MAESGLIFTSQRYTYAFSVNSSESPLYRVAKRESIEEDAWQTKM